MRKFLINFFIFTSFLSAQNTKQQNVLSQDFEKAAKLVSSNPDEAIKKLITLKAIALKENNTGMYLKILNKINLGYYTKADHHQTIQSTDFTIKEAQKYNDPVSEAGARYLQGYTFLQLGFYNEAEQTIDTGLKIIKNDTTDDSYNARGTLYAVKAKFFGEKIKDQKSTLVYFKKSLKEFEKIKEENLRNQCLINANSNLAINFADFKNTDSAFYYNKVALQLNPIKYGMYDTQSFIYMSLGFTYQEMKDKEKALLYYLKSVQISDSIKDMDISLENYKRIKDLYKEKNDTENFEIYNKKYTRLKDSLDNQSKSKMDETLTTIVNNKKQETQKPFYSVIIGLGLLSLVVSGLVMVYYKKSKKEKQEKDEAVGSLSREIQEKIKSLEFSTGDYSKELKQLAKDNSPNFYVRFSEIYPEINRVLSVKYTQLSVSDKSFLAMVCLSFTNKELANILELGLKTIEMKKYRIRKKCNLDTGIDLKNWIITLVLKK